MPIDIMSMLNGETSPRDSEQLQVCNRWCKRYYHDGGYHELSEPLWGVGASVFNGRMCVESVALQGNSPYTELWREHYMSLIEKLKAVSLDYISFPAAVDLRRRIEILASKNHYPPYSLMHIVAWANNVGGFETLDYAIFQSRLPESVFYPKKPVAYLRTEERTLFITPGRVDALGGNRVVEHIAARNAIFEKFADIDCAGSVLLDANGRVVRTTLGNIYFVFDRQVVGVSNGGGAYRDVLCKHVEELCASVIPKVPYRFMRVDGIEFTDINRAAECFVCDPTVGVLPVMTIGTTKRFRNEFGYKMAAAMKERIDF